MGIDLYVRHALEPDLPGDPESEPRGYHPQGQCFCRIDEGPYGRRDVEDKAVGVDGLFAAVDHLDVIGDIAHKTADRILRGETKIGQIMVQEAAAQIGGHVDHEFERQRVIADPKLLVKVVRVFFLDVARDLEGGQHMAFPRACDAAAQMFQKRTVRTNMDRLPAIVDMDLVVEGCICEKSHDISPENRPNRSAAN